MLTFTLSQGEMETPLSQKDILIKMKVTLLISFFIGIIPDFVICYLIMKFLNEGWGVFWLVYIGIQIIRTLRWVYLKLADSILYRMKWKIEIKKGIYSGLVDKKFPNPKSFTYTSTETYFNDVSRDSDAEWDTRLMAKEILTILESVRRLKGFQAYLQWEKSAELALSEYSKKFT